MISLPILEIDLNIIKQNYIKIRELTSAEVAATLKADAYGLGATQIARALMEENCKTFFVSNFKEALQLKNAFSDLEVYFYNGFTAGEEAVIVSNGISPVISSLYQVDLLNNYCKENNIRYKTILHVETGMQRLSMPREEVMILSNNRDRYSHLDIEYIISHLASSEEFENEFNYQQLIALQEIASHFPSARCSIANTCGILLGKEYHLDMVRPGAGIYGLNLRNDMRFFSNPIRLISCLLQIKYVKRGSTIGYNQTYVAPKDMWIGTTPFGYADGIFRSLSNNGYCYIKGKKIPIVGRISMDSINLDLTPLDEAERFIGQEVELISDNQTPDDLSKFAGTIGYEIITSLGQRYERKYKK
ncbi:MAG: alanine racemase [Rickettsiaceae bacterium]|nr:alanine racemase [Rickettsiaceae bacterium]